ncbi:MAG: DNA polymerase beta [Alphaproteobacteria bacterium HGW-Alphaproteobacteria-11]|nr:MAG: DNA polymerase beta [Alphaproteobacteria bacterium HGW-Alphaproteobacteria-11]
MRKFEEIAEELRRMRPNLRRRYPISAIGVFGSYARGDQTEASDLDVLVELDGDIGMLAFVGLQQELSDALGLKVDLVTKDALKPRIGKRILAEAVML